METTYGVFQHSSGPQGGFVARELVDGHPDHNYRDQAPLKVYKTRKGAERYATLLTYGPPIAEPSSTALPAEEPEIVQQWSPGKCYQCQATIPVNTWHWRCRVDGQVIRYCPTCQELPPPDPDRDGAPILGTPALALFVTTVLRVNRDHASGDALELACGHTKRYAGMGEHGAGYFVQPGHRFICSHADHDQRPAPCAQCKELPDPAFGRATVEPQLPAPYAPVYCQRCQQVNRATGLLIGLERAYVFCRQCPAIVARADGPYCAAHTPEPSDTTPCGHPAARHFCLCYCEPCKASAAESARIAEDKHAARKAAHNDDARAQLAARGLPLIAGGSVDADGWHRADCHRARQCDRCGSWPQWGWWRDGTVICNACHGDAPDALTRYDRTPPCHLADPPSPPQPGCRCVACTARARDDEAHAYADWARPTLAQRIALALSGRLPAMAGGSLDTAEEIAEDTARLAPIFAALLQDPDVDPRRLSDAARLLDDVERDPTRAGAWLVRSASDPTRAYHVVQGLCDCPDAQHHDAKRCKHALSVRAFQMLERVDAEAGDPTLLPMAGSAPRSNR